MLNNSIGCLPTYMRVVLNNSIGSTFYSGSIAETQMRINPTRSFYSGVLGPYILYSQFCFPFDWGAASLCSCGEQPFFRSYGEQPQNRTDKLGERPRGRKQKKDSKICNVAGDMRLIFRWTAHFVAQPSAATFLYSSPECCKLQCFHEALR